jgi:hypothetical protein
MCSRALGNKVDAVAICQKLCIDGTILTAILYRRITALLLGEKFGQGGSEDDVGSNLSDEEEEDSANNRKTFGEPTNPKPLDESDAYQWLIFKLCQHDRLSFPDTNTLKEIGTMFFSQLCAQGRMRKMSRHKPTPLASITFQLNWDPRLYSQILNPSNDPSGILSKCLCLTGTRSEAQALTVSEYVLQTWPVTGKHIIHLLEELIALPNGQEFVCEFRSLNIQLKPNGASTDHKPRGRREHLEGTTRSGNITVIAGPHFLSDIAEQIAWLAATLRPKSKSQSVIVCRPRIESFILHELPSGSAAMEGTCVFTVDYEKVLKNSESTNGFCWSRLFSNSTLVSGYPIISRQESNLGLEVSLNTMGCLVQSNVIVQCGRRILMKGLNSLLLATMVTSGMFLWHALVTAEGERISYFDDHLDSLELKHEGIPSLRMLEGARHIVGWCTHATDFCGEYSTMLRL